MNLLKRISNLYILPSLKFIYYILINPFKQKKIILILSDFKNSVSEAQLEQFDFDSHELIKKLNLYPLKLGLYSYRFLLYFGNLFSYIGIKANWDYNEDKLVSIIKEIKLNFPNAKIVYFDGDDDATISKIDILELVDLYIKKQGFVDLNNYKLSWIGGNNLTDYVHKKFNVAFNNKRESLSEDTYHVLVKKLFIAYNLTSGYKIHNLYNKIEFNINKPRQFDICYRASIPNNWMGNLRSCMQQELEELSKRYKVIRPSAPVNQEKYYEEMLSSKICISPFGYGEQCWRDFEAIICGALLFKPNISHLITVPNLFIEYETYIPLDWNYNDLIEKSEIYLNNESERKRISSNAYNLIRDYYENNGFIELTEKWIKKVSSN